MNRLVFAVAFWSVAMPLGAQAPLAQTRPASRAMAHDTANIYARKSMRAVRLQTAGPVIDGKLDDAVWQTAPAGTDFIQNKPNPGKPATEKTEIRFTYDDDAIYVAARMYDSHPDSIVAQLARRDHDVYSEWIFIALDSYYDRRTAFTFALNPRGVKVDLLLYDDTNDDESWDAVWDGAARVDSLGWTAEFRIPLSQLRFAAAKTADGETPWGMDVMRRIARRNEESFWSAIRPDGNEVVSAFGDLLGIAGLKPSRHMEIMPYSMSRLVRAPSDAGNPFFHANDGAVGAGADLKMSVTSDLTLTATVNPDFGQVEADPSVVNLTAYETFFPEKRPFFVEGFDIFRVGIGIGDGDGGNEGLFYSRRIGRAPQGELPDEAEFSDVPQQATILGAAKLSGKTKNGWSVGVLSASTARETAPWVDENNPSLHREAVVEPFTHYGVARVIKDFNKGQDAIGAVLTATNRDLPDNLKSLRANAYTGGLTGRKRWQNGNYQLDAYIVGSYVNGDTSAINATQRSSARYYQRPDNDHVTYDPTRTSLAGFSGAVQMLKRGGGHWRYGGILNTRSPGFETNDLGYMQSTDQIVNVLYVGYNQYKPGKHFNNWNVNTNQWIGWTWGGERNSFGGNINGSAQLKNTAEIWAGINREQPVLSEGALRGGPAIMRPGVINFHTGYDSDERKPINFWLSFNYNKSDDNPGRNIGFRPGLRVRASNRAEVRLNPGLSWNRSAWQYVDAPTVGNQDYYVFASLKQVTTSLTFRLSYTFTPTMSLEAYAEPFISAGQYSGFKEVTNPRAEKFADRFRAYSRITYDADDNEYAIDRDGNGSSDFTIDNPDFNYRALRSNVVLRWEYRPGSALFLVWSQGRDRFNEYGDFSLRRDADRLFGAQPTNVLLIKASYWLGI